MAGERKDHTTNKSLMCLFFFGVVQLLTGRLKGSLFQAGASSLFGPDDSESP